MGKKGADSLMKVEVNRKSECKTSVAYFDRKRNELLRTIKSLTPYQKEQAILRLIQSIEENNIVSEKDFINKIKLNKRDILIPISIFNERLSSLETIVKYLKENYCLRYSEIAHLLSRDDRTIWATYFNAKKKFPDKFKIIESEYSVPISLFADRSKPVLSIIISFLKKRGLRYCDIARLLKRDQRTIWTTYNRRPN